MRVLVYVNTAGAGDGFEPDEVPTFSGHKYEIDELLRLGNYHVEKIEVLK